MQLAVDIGATKTAFGVFDARPEPVYLHNEVTPASSWPAFSRIFTKNIEAAENKHGDFMEIGISVAGTIDPRTAAVACANLPAISNRKLAHEIAALTGKAIFLRNDAECLALAETAHGAGKTYQTVFVIILGSGIGGAITVGKQLLTGATGRVGEWGHGNEIDHLVRKHGLVSRHCGDGRKNCLDLFGAGLGMANIHEDLHGERLVAEAILSLWHDNSPAAQTTMTAFIDIVSSQLALVLNVIDPDIVPVAGGLSKDSRLIAELDIATRARLLGVINRPLIVPAELNEFGCLLGASMLNSRNTAA